MATQGLTFLSSSGIFLFTSAVHSHRHSLDIAITYNAAPSKLLIQALLCSTVTSHSSRERCAKRRIIGTLASLALPVLCCLLTHQPFPSYPAWISWAVFLYSLVCPTFLYSHLYSLRLHCPSVASICLSSVPGWTPKSVSLCLHPSWGALPNEADWFHSKFKVINFKQVLTLYKTPTIVLFFIFLFSTVTVRNFLLSSRLQPPFFSSLNRWLPHTTLEKKIGVLT